LDVCCDLLELFGGVTDGRVGPGRDHPVAAVLALAAAADNCLDDEDAAVRQRPPPCAAGIAVPLLPI